MDEKTRKAVRETMPGPDVIRELSQYFKAAGPVSQFKLAVCCYNYGYICGKRDERKRQKRKRTGQRCCNTCKTIDPVHQHMVDFIRKWAVEQDEKNVAIAYHFIKHCKVKGGAE